MRSILALFIIVALGFTIILKKDTPKSVAPKKQPEQVAQPPKNNWVKHRIEQSDAVGHVAVNERER
ncbi:MAG: hypothetical protein ABR514_01620 [Chthoniobacterales bacterium]